MPNAFAYLALFSWPLIAVLMFRALPLRRAIVWTIIGGYLLLPERTGIDLPMLPAFDKRFLPAAAALLLCLPHLRGPSDLLPRARIPRFLVLVFLLSPLVTVALNGEPAVFGSRILPGLQLYDAFSFGLSHLVLLMPFLLGQRFLADESAMRDLLTAIALAGLAYSLPALLEIRFSPQLHTWVYGFFPHKFLQQMRGDGFRPVVFLQHGLRVALFFSMALIATAALWRGYKGAMKLRWGLGALWLAVIVMLCKTYSALAYTALLVPVILFAGWRLQRLALLAIGLTALLYPALRGADLIPTQELTSLVASVDERRADSLQFRFDNEEILLEHANAKPFFGWGEWKRNRVFDPRTGEDISTTDGVWVILIGQYGWIGYVAAFGLLTWPLLVVGAARRRASFATIAACLVLAANLIDLIPNSGLSPLTWMIAGGITGRLRNPKPATSPKKGASLAGGHLPT